MPTVTLTQIPLLYTTSETVLFYGWWQFGTCLFAFIALVSIWWHIGKRQNDLGQVWLALSILCWSISGLAEVVFVSKGATGSALANGSRSILSLFNSLFILLALPWFRYLPKLLSPIIQSKYWLLIVGLPFLFSLLPTLRSMVMGSDLSNAELDVYYAVLTLVFLGAVLWQSFSRRRLTALAYLSLVCIAITLLAQFYKLTGSVINLTLFSAIFKTCLIMIFFALALSWVKELSENTIPVFDRISLALQRKREHDKVAHKVAIGGFSGASLRMVKLTATQYGLLSQFAKNRKEDSGSWLEIRPKNNPVPDKTYDIADYNEIRRLLLALLDGIFGKGNWTNEQHLEPFKEAMFELSKKRERKIRLRVLPENIHF